MDGVYGVEVVNIIKDSNSKTSGPSQRELKVAV